jgi:RHS repeat-associated protein
VTGNGNSYALSYDALGRCVKRTLNGTTTYYTYDGPHSIYEWKGDGTVAGWNLYGGSIDEILLRADYQVLSNGQGYFFQQSRLGSVTHLTGFSGELIESYRYDAFGQPTTTYSGGVFNNRFKFTGREYQSALGIYEYRNRAYHPGLGRFLSEDPMGFAAGDSNIFRYCGGDPVNRRDPFGLGWGGSGTKTYNTEDIDPGSDPPPAYNPDNNSIIIDPLSPDGDTAGGPENSGSTGSTNNGTGPVGSIAGAPGTSDGGASLASLGNGLGLISNDASGSLPDTGGGAATVFRPSPDATNLPRSGGLLITPSANAGLIWGGGANVALAYGLYSNDKPGGWKSNGAMLGGPTGAFSHVDPRSVNQIPLIFGAGVSIAGGAWFSNAATRQDLMGPFREFWNRHALVLEYLQYRPQWYLCDYCYIWIPSRGGCHKLPD